MTGRRVGLIVLAVAVLIQLVPVTRSNPAVEEEVTAPPRVKEILRRSCYDCHSNETVWPWYSRVAPVSWQLAHDVSEARGHLNFSTWDRYDAGERLHKLREVWEQVEEGEMPLWMYLLMHPAARLSPADRDAIRDWVASSGARLGHDHGEDDDHHHDRDHGE